MTPLCAAVLDADLIDLTIVIPCLNEASTIGVVAEKAQRSIYRLRLTREVLVSDNRSTDGSAEIAQDLGAFPQEFSLPDPGRVRIR